MPGGSAPGSSNGQSLSMVSKEEFAVLHAHDTRSLEGCAWSGSKREAPLLCALSDVPDSYSIPTTWSEAQSSCSIGSLRAALYQARARRLCRAG